MQSHCYMIAIVIGRIFIRLIVHSRQMTSSRRLSDRKVKPVDQPAITDTPTVPESLLHSSTILCSEYAILTSSFLHLTIYRPSNFMKPLTYGEQSQRLYDFAYSTVEFQIHGNLQKSIIQLRVFQSRQRESQMVTTLLFTYSQHGCDRCTVFQGLYAMYKLFKNFEQYVQLMSVTLQQTVEFWTSDEIIAAVSTQQENCRHKPSIKVKAFDACCNILLHKRPSLRLQRHWELMMCKSTYICPSEAASPSMEVPFVMYYSNA
ncbi:hypothetical protein T07_11598 [Trichinella nelsoni]|uniref:Uncharacterized protein n=1 Tax=Trichinella nelsoni TaxID=6336 RepID=A0A0V0SHV7_9BILA|nr:hypothetical protein T07_11598 [Trichinella nelsoni]